MEPPVRPYNPNGPGGARQNVANSGKRPQTAETHDSLPAPRLATQAAPSVAARVPRAPRAPVTGVASQPLATPDVADVAPTPGAKRAPSGRPRGGRRGSSKAKDAAKVAEGEEAEQQAERDNHDNHAHASAVGQMTASPSGPLAPIAADSVDSLEVVEATPQEGVSGAVIGVADFEDIFTRFQTPLTNFVFRLVGNREQAYDLTQDVFVKAYRALSGGTTIQAAALSSWLYRIASNTATDALRRRRLISWLPLSLFNEDRGVGAGMPGMETPNAQQTQGEEALATGMSAFASGYDGSRFEQRVADREIVQRVLRRLPEKYAQCLLFYEYEGFSCAEIADMLSVSPSAVKMRLMRARERFITLYQEEVNG